MDPRGKLYIVIDTYSLGDVIDILVYHGILGGNIMGLITWDIMILWSWDFLSHGDHQRDSSRGSWIP